MLGVALDSYTEVLRKVPVHRNKQPYDISGSPVSLGQNVYDYLVENYDDNPPFEAIKYVPLSEFAHLSFDQLSKLRQSFNVTMNNSVEKLFEDDPKYQIIHKLENSMWHWGGSKRSWNDIVDAYNGIRSFKLDGFDVRFDHTTSYNECGPGQYSRTVFDGVFGFLVYYKGEHVMTLGFSVANNKRILLSQVQLKKATGNRWLFKLPKGRMEFVLDAFKAAFPKHRLFIVDGESVALKNLNFYRNARQNEHRIMMKYKKSQPEWAAKARAQKKMLRAKMKHMESEVDRLAASYRNVGTGYSLGEVSYVRNKLKFREVTRLN